MSFARFSVLIDGEATKVKKESGRETISLFLFIMVIEIMSLMIKKSAGDGLISGFSVAPHGTTINHLQFADDLIIFLDDSVEQIRNLKSILI